MSVHDLYGLPITGACELSAQGYNAYVGEFLGYGDNLRALFSVADNTPGAPLINAHAAALHMAFEGAEGWRAAEPYLTQMRTYADRAAPREKLFCDAVDAWSAQNFTRAGALLDTLTVRWPADLCAVKWGQYHAFNLGDAAALLRFGRRAVIAHENTPYAHGLIAFALEQNHHLGAAEEEGVRAVEIAIDDAWAQHAVAHVMDSQGRARDGARWLDHCAHTWARKGVFIRDHNWWHAALFQLALGAHDEALKIFDDHLWGAWPEFPQEQIGAISMLWRLELRGVDVGARWAPIVAQVRARVSEHIFPFHNLHYLYALARAGEAGEAERFFHAMKTHRDADWAAHALPAGDALLAFVRGRYDEAAQGLTKLLPALHRIGGSHAQRHVFVETVEVCRMMAATGATALTARRAG